MMLKYYISGPITGMPDQNKAAFQAAEELIKSSGCEAVNPLTNPIHETREDDTWTGYMRRDICLLMDCDAVMTLSGWEKSRGAKIEVELAKKLRIPVVEYNPLSTENKCGKMKP